MMSHRDRLFLKWNKNRGDVQTHNTYKKLKNRTRQKIKKSKREYYKNYFETHKNNMKQLWSGIKSIITTKIKSHHMISQIRVENVDYDDPKIIADKFNSFFINVAESVQKSIPNAPKSHRDYLKSPNPQSIFLYPCAAKEVEDIIHLLSPAKVSGPYSIPVKLIKLLDNHISPPLIVLINDSFITGIFPSKLKISKVTPLHKKGSNLDPDNYHPISLLSVFSKIYEKIMCARIYKFMENSRLFYSRQFGFRSNHSTNHALISITGSIKNSIDNGKFGCGIFLDLKKHLTQLATVFC